METKPLKFTNITADIVTDADTDADVMETQLKAGDKQVYNKLNNKLILLVFNKSSASFYLYV